MALAITWSPNTSPPRAEALIASDDDRATFIAARYELKEQVGSLAVDWQVANLVNYQKLRLTE